MVNSKYLECFNDSVKDDRNIVTKNNLSKFIEDNYFNGRVADVRTGTTVTFTFYENDIGNYDIEIIL